MKKNTHLPYAIVTALAIIIFYVILYLTGQMFNKALSWGALVIYLVGIILACINFSKANDNNVTFGNVFGAGFRATLVIVLITIIWTAISFSVFPAMKDQYIEMVHETMVKQGQSQEIIDKGMAMVTNHFVLKTVVMTMFSNLFTGVIFSLIGAAIAKKKPKQPTVQPN